MKDKEFLSGNEQFEALSLGHQLENLQQRLTAADGRARVLEGLLREVVENDYGEYSLGGDWHRRYRASLKPAEGASDA